MVFEQWISFLNTCRFINSLHCIRLTRNSFAVDKPLRWRHNDHGGVSNHQPHSCLLNRLVRRRSKKTSKLRVTGHYAGNSPGPVNSPHKGPVARKMFLFDDVIMLWRKLGRIDLALDLVHPSTLTNNELLVDPGIKIRLESAWCCQHQVTDPVLESYGLFTWNVDILLRETNIK